MSLLVDQYGNPITSSLGSIGSRQFSRAADPTGGERPAVWTKLDDIQKLIRPSSRRILVAVSRLMVENWGPTRAIARQIPMYSVGRAWKPTSHAASSRFKKKAEAMIREEFWPIANISGGDMTTAIYHMALMLVRDGEAFVLLSEYSTGFPAIQVIPSHRIGSRGYEPNGETIQSGAYKGAKMTDGVVTNRAGQVIAYHFLGDNEKEDRFLDARSVVHVFDSDYPEGVRGYPAMTHGLTDGLDSLQSHEWERFNMLVRSAHTLIEKNPNGAPDYDPTAAIGSDDSSCCGPKETTIKQLQGGMVRFIQAGTGSEIESLKHDTPGPIYESYTDRMIQSICAGVPWPFSFVWAGAKRGQGTAERRDIEQARRTIDDIQSTLEPAVRRIIGYATAKLQKLGKLESSADWWRWRFSYPPKLTIDDGRVTRARLDLHQRGVVSDDDLLADLGHDPDEYWEAKFSAASRKKAAFMKWDEATPGGLDPRIMGMLSSSEPAPQEIPYDEDGPDKETDEDDEDYDSADDRTA